MRAKVSILIPVYNRENLIFETISSALSQTYNNIEVVIVDNASTDSTWDIIQEFVKKDRRIAAFRNEKNIGPVKNWMRCVKYATGDYAKILWSDDLISEIFIEECMPYLECKDVGFVFTQATVFTKNPSEGEVRYFLGETGLYNTDKFIKSDIKGEDSPLSPGNAIFRMIDLEKNLLIDVPNSVGSDFSMHAIGNDLLIYLLTAHEYSKFGFVAKPLAFFRSHPGSISISADHSKLSLHYNLARAYFVENYRTDLIRALNARLFLHLIRNKTAKYYGVKSMTDFYVNNKNVSMSVYVLCVNIMSKVTRLIRKISQLKN